MDIEAQKETKGTLKGTDETCLKLIEQASGNETA